MVQFEHLHKRFGDRIILEDVSFSVPKGVVFGFLGENGAGKTTTMKILLGLLAADSGFVRIMGEEVRYGQNSTNRYIGYLPDVPAFYGYMKPMEYLTLCGKITGMRGKELTKRGKEMLELVGLEKQNKAISGFSRGMKQRLGIAQALLNKPKLLVCDEPTSALDPVGRKEMLDLFSKVKEQTTVIFSTHILADVERICDQIALLHRGRISLQGGLADLKEKHSTSMLEVVLPEYIRKRKDTVKSLENSLKTAGFQIIEVETEGHLVWKISVKDVEKDGRFLLEQLLKAQVVPLSFQVAEPSLENLFMEGVK